MQARLKLKPGQRGTKKLLAEYGDRLFCVRYRYDEERRKRYKTVELIVDEVDWTPPPVKRSAVVAVRVGWEERELQKVIREAGGRWDGKNAVWRLAYGRVCKLKLEDRIVAEDSIQDHMPMPVLSDARTRR